MSKTKTHIVTAKRRYCVKCGSSRFLRFLANSGNNNWTCKGKCPKRNVRK